MRTKILMFLLLISVSAFQQKIHAQNSPEINEQDFIQAAGAAIFTPLCSPEVNALEKILGLEPGYISNDMKKRVEEDPGICEKTNFYSFTVYKSENPKIQIGAYNVSDCNFLIKSISLSGYMSELNENSLLVKVIKQYNIPVFEPYTDKKNTILNRKMEITGADGNTYELNLDYYEYFNSNNELAQKMFKLDKVPKKHSLISSVGFSISQEQKNKIRNVTGIELDDCDIKPAKKQVIAQTTTSTDGLSSELEKVYKSYSADDLKRLNLPTDFEDWTKLTNLWEDQDSDRLILFNEAVSNEGYRGINKRQYVKYKSGVIPNAKGDLLFEGKTWNYFYYGYPTGIGLVRTFSKGTQLKGHYILGMPHGVMQYFKSENDSTPLMYYFGKQLKDQITIEQDGKKLVVFTVNGEPQLTGLVTEIHPNGTEAQCIYVNGERQEILNTKYADGSFFNGELDAELKPNGYGTWFLDPKQKMGFTRVEGNFINGKPVAEERYTLYYGKGTYFLECTIDENLLPHSPDGYKAVVWTYKKDEDSKCLVNYEHGKPTSVKDFGISSWDVDGYPKGMRLRYYIGEVDSVLVPHGKGELHVDEGRVIANNIWTGIFEHGQLKEGQWAAPPFERLKASEKKEEENYNNVVDKFFEVSGFSLNSDLKYKAHIDMGRGLRAETIISIENRGNGAKILILDKSNNATAITVEHFQNTLNSEGKRIKWIDTTPPQTDQLKYSNVFKGNDGKEFRSCIMTFSKESLKYFETLDLTIKANDEWANLFIYVIY